MKKTFVWFTLLIIFLFEFPKTIDARSGCCSYHGGVCGCGCCDGTPLSTTCAPYYPQCSQPVYVAPAPTKVPILYTAKPTVQLSPTTNPTENPTATPEVKAASTGAQPSPTPRPTSTSDTFIGLGILGFVGWLVWKGLKRLGRKVGETKKDPTRPI